MTQSCLQFDDYLFFGAPFTWCRRPKYFLYVHIYKAAELFFSNHGDVCYILDMFGCRQQVKVDAKSDAILFNIAGSFFFLNFFLLQASASNVPKSFLSYSICISRILGIEHLPRNLKGGIRSLFDPCVNATGHRPYCPSRMEVSYCTFGFSTIIWHNLRTLSLLRDPPRDNLYACVIWVHAGRQLTLNEIIWCA